MLEQNGLPEAIGCMSFNSDGTRLHAALRSTFYSMDSQILTKAVEKRIFDSPIVCIAPFNLRNQSYNLVLGDEEGHLHLIDSREATTVKDRLFKSRTEGVAITSMAVDDKFVYVACENGIVEVFDLKKRVFVKDFEFSEKMLTHIFIDDNIPVVSTDEGEILWLQIDQGRVMHKASEPDVIIERVVPISDEYALVKPMIGDNLMLLSLTEKKFMGKCSSEPAVDIASTANNEQIIVGLDKTSHVDLEIWDTATFLKEYTSRSARSNGHTDTGFFSGLNGEGEL